MRNSALAALSAAMVLALGAAGCTSWAGAAESAPLAKNEAEAHVLSVIQEVERTQGADAWAIPEADGRLLRVLAESIGAKHVVELGTSRGYSGLWFALALRATGGKLTTFEIDPERIATARTNFRKAKVDDLITIVQGDAHVEVTKLKEPIDLLFIDADKDGYLDYLNKLLPLVRPSGLIVAHNMRSPVPDQRFVQAITSNRDLETLFLNMHDRGIAVTLKKR